MIAFVTFQKEVVLAIINQSYTAKQFFPIPQILAIKLGMLTLKSFYYMLEIPYDAYPILGECLIGCSPLSVKSYASGLVDIG